MLTLRNLQKEDVPLLMTYDKKVPLSEWDTLLHGGRVLVAEHNGRFSGWLRYDFSPAGSPWSIGWGLFCRKTGRRSAKSSCRNGRPGPGFMGTPG